MEVDDGSVENKGVGKKCKCIVLALDMRIEQPVRCLVHARREKGGEDDDEREKKREVDYI